MSKIATVLHISDLHFAEKLTAEGGLLASKTIGAKPHSYTKLVAVYVMIAHSGAKSKKSGLASLAGYEYLCDLNMGSHPLTRD